MDTRRNTEVPTDYAEAHAMRTLIIAFILALLVWIGPRNGAMEIVGIATFWLTVFGVISMVVRSYRSQ